MTPKDLIELLNRDLANEYKHWHFYMNAAIRVQGLHREQLRTFLLSEAAGEMQHIQQFGDLIIGLGGTPCTTINAFANNLTDPKHILAYALEMEEEVVKNYLEHKAAAKKLGGLMGSRVEIFLDNQIQQSAGDADHIRQMLAGI